MFEKIVLAIDGSPDSKKAITVTRDLGKAHKAQVLVVHVHEHAYGRGAPALPETPEEAQSLVDKCVADLGKAGLKVNGEVLHAIFGRAAGSIVKAADDSSAGLIIMGTRGRSNLAGLLLGSVSHKVIQLAHCPVLVAR